MSAQLTMAGEPKEERPESAATQPGPVPSGRLVGPVGTVLLIAYLLAACLLLLYALIELWPNPTPSMGTAQGQASNQPPPPSEVQLFGTSFLIAAEVRLLLIVALTGALGGLVHTLRSLYWYVGNRALVRSWLPLYIMKPFVGTTLGLVFYLVFRGGLFSSQASVEQTSPFGFAALAALVGMFSEEAVEKLKQAASTLLAPAPQGADYEPPRMSTEAETAARLERQQGGVAG